MPEQRSKFKKGDVARLKRPQYGFPVGARFEVELDDETTMMLWRPLQPSPEGLTDALWLSDDDLELALAPLTPALEAAFRAKYGPQIGDTVKVKEGAGFGDEGVVNRLLDDGYAKVQFKGDFEYVGFIDFADLEVTAYGPGISSRKSEE